MNNVVDNLRRQYGEKLADYSDKLIDAAWKDFSQSEDYFERDNNPQLFLDWVENTPCEDN